MLRKSKAQHGSDLDEEALIEGEDSFEGVDDAGSPTELFMASSRRGNMRRVLIFLLFCLIAMVLLHGDLAAVVQLSPKGIDVPKVSKELSKVAEQDEAAASKWVDIRRRCPDGSKIELVMPHVNKAGGRSMESTFMDLDVVAGELRHRHVSMAPRSRTHTFALRDHHYSYPALAMQLKCFKAKSVCADCEITNEELCRRWVFTLRNPMHRMLSAFYATVGREHGSGIPSKQKPPEQRTPIRGGTGAFGDSHFFCNKGSKIAKLMEDSTFTIEGYAAQPVNERRACSRASNIHVKYLAPEEKDGSNAQLELAKRRLEQMSWFGLLDRWTESLQLFQYALGTDLVHHVPTFNHNVYPKNISMNAKAVLMEQNELDMKLFEFASELFDERVQTMRSDRYDPFSNHLAFNCDKEQICWNKMRTGESWSADEENQDIQGIGSDAEAKKRILCTYRKGCWRADVEAPFQDRPEEPYLSSRSRCFGSVFILGARKGGTTSLYQYISAHPRFYGVKLDAKEQAGELLFLHTYDLQGKQSAVQIRSAYNEVFVNELQKMYGTNDDNAGKAWLREIERGAAITGESTVAIGPACQVSRQLAAACGANPNLRLLYLVRNPIERLISNYRMRFRLNTVSGKKTLTQMAKDDLTSLKKKIPKTEEWWTLPGRDGSLPCLYKQDYMNAVWSGMYVVHLSRWLQDFSSEQLLVLKSEDFFHDPADTMRKVFKFLQLDASVIDIDQIVETKFNAASSSTSSEASGNEISQVDLLLSVRKELQDFYKPYNEALSKTFRVDISDWL